MARNWKLTLRGSGRTKASGSEFKGYLPPLRFAVGLLYVSVETFFRERLLVLDIGVYINEGNDR